MTKGAALNANRKKKNNNDERRGVAIPSKLPMPIGIEIHNCSVPPVPATRTTTTTSAISATATAQALNTNGTDSQLRKKKWFHQTEYSMRLLPKQIRLELCLLEEQEEEAEGSSSSAIMMNQKTKQIICLAKCTDTRHSTRVIFSHLDDLIARDALDIYSYEQLTARFYHLDHDNCDSSSALSSSSTSSSTSSRLLQHRQTTIIPPVPTPTTAIIHPYNNQINRPFVQMNLHPSRLCRIPSLEPVVSLLPKHAIIVYFSDQSIRISPTLYQYLRSINEAFVTVEEKIFADTAFYTLDQVVVVSSSSSSSSSKDKTEKIHPESMPKNTTQMNGSNQKKSLSDDKTTKPTQATVELEDLQAENEMLQMELHHQEELLRDELLHNNASSTSTPEVVVPTKNALQSTLDQLHEQNRQLAFELDRRTQHANALQCALHCERVRLIRQVSSLYNIAVGNTTTTTTTTTATTSSVMNNDDTVATIRGLPVSNAISFCNHVIHILLPKYLGIFVRPPPPSQRTAVQRTLAWNATLHCIARNIGMAGTGASVPPIVLPSSSSNSTPPSNNTILHSIRDIYNHILQYHHDDKDHRGNES